ncbi:hypothetical protein J8273_2974 [Carpediemonas membranifera]|uniref:Uncharacterized protein n=1 Tax=Carpediemonas membranifera TaxID=201153 RepID=A0A8J6E580_9EUKA|nr:hypothetical protein J8273_2974 [Carpediemonas membranifera]|eukprot:KAG9395407.1 hypothetical protein J8273_2974 [Carpediemonas membranifera]
MPKHSNFDTVYAQILTTLTPQDIKPRKPAAEEETKDKPVRRVRILKPEIRRGIAPGKTSIQQLIDQTVNDLRHDHLALSELEEKVKSIRSERDKMTREKYSQRNMIRDNIHSAGDVLGQTALLRTSRGTHFEHIEAVRRRRDELFSEKQARRERALSAKEGRVGSLAARFPAAHRQRRSLQWIAACTARHSVIEAMLLRCHDIRLFDEKLNGAAIVIQRYARQWLEARHREEKKVAGLVLAAAVTSFGLKRRVKSKMAATAVVQSFLSDLGQVAQISTAVQRFRHHVVVVQGAWRNYVVRTHARRYLIELSFRAREGEAIKSFLIDTRQKKLDREYSEAKKKETALNKSRLGPGLGKAKKLHRSKANVSETEIDERRLTAAEVTELCFQRMQAHGRGEVPGLGLWTIEEVEAQLDLAE